MHSISPTLLPTSPSFAGHQTFAVRSGWLKKGVDALQDDRAGAATVFTRQDALVTLGVGKNMVQSIRHWLLATQMAEERPGARGRELRPTQLGSALLGSPNSEGWDPFLEDQATLWVLHWQLASPGGPAFSWVWTFNLFREYDFTRDLLVDAIMDGASGRVPKAPSRETVGRDVECLLHTYLSPREGAGDDELDCPLRALGLIQPSYDRHYRFGYGPKPELPTSVFFYAVEEYWQWRRPESLSLTAWDLTYAEGSPGTVFKLDEDSVLGYLDRADGRFAEAFRFEDTPLTRQLVRNEGPALQPLELLRAHYEG
jgi:hypothetical protein